MEQTDLIRGYATAMFEFAEAEGALDRVADELFRFSKALEQNNELRSALTDLALPVDRKIAVVDDILGDRASDHTRNMLRFVISQNRARELPEIVGVLSNMAAASRNQVVAEVRTAFQLTKEQESQLADALSKATGKTVDVKVVVDPNVIGGVFAQVGDQIIDGTIRRKLQELTERLEA